MFDIHSARARRRDARTKAEALCDAAIASGKDLSGEDLKQYKALAAEIKNIEAQIDRHEAGAFIGPPSDGGPNFNALVSPAPARHREHSVTGLLRDAMFAATAEQRQQVTALACYLSGDIRAAADLKPSGDGAFIIPSFVQTVLERNYEAFSPVANVARLFPTDTGADTTFPVLSDSESAVQLASAAATGADATVSGDTPPTDLTGPKLGAYKVSSKPVFVPRETITDSPTDIIQEIIGALLARIIRFENLKYTKGTGVGEAEGFLTNAIAHAAGAVALDLDIALDLAYNVGPLYRANGVYQMSDTTAKYLRKLKTGLTGDKRQLWADADATKGTPATLHGYPVAINNDMDSVAADGTFAAKVPLAFGDFKKFVVRQAENGAPFAYRYAVPAKDGGAVILFRRSDSKLVVPEAISKLTV